MCYVVCEYRTGQHATHKEMKCYEQDIKYCHSQTTWAAANCLTARPAASRLLVKA